MSKDSVDLGVWFGLVFMAIVTFILNFFVYSELKHQRDTWLGLYCIETKLELDFCEIPKE